MAPPRQGPRLVLHASDADHLSALDKCIYSHPINHAVQVVLPWPADGMEAAAPLALTQLRSWSSCHQLATISLSALLDPQLKQRLFATDGVRFQALSIRGQGEQGDTAAVTPAGLLRLSVCEDTYQQLGLVGKQSVLAPGDRHIIDVDLTAKKFIPASRHYLRVLQCLESRSPALQLLCLQTMDGEPTPVPWPAAKPSAQRCSSLAAAHHAWRLQDVAFPLLQLLPVGNHGLAAQLAETLPGVLDWLGGVGCGFACRELLPERVEVVQGDAEVLQWEGLLCCSQVATLVRLARDAMQGAQLPWAHVSVWGFADSPVAWAAAEHGAAAGQAASASHFSVLLLPGGRFVVARALGSGDPDAGGASKAGT